MSPMEGIKKVQKGGFAFQVDVALAYKIIDVSFYCFKDFKIILRKDCNFQFFLQETFTEEEICDLAEVTLLPGKHTATVTAKHSPFKKMVTYGSVLNLLSIIINCIHNINNIFL